MENFYNCGSLTNSDDEASVISVDSCPESCQEQPLQRYQHVQNPLLNRQNRRQNLSEFVSNFAPVIQSILAAARNLHLQSTNPELEEMVVQKPGFEPHATPPLLGRLGPRRVLPNRPARREQQLPQRPLQQQGRRLVMSSQLQRQPQAQPQSQCQPRSQRQIREALQRLAQIRPDTRAHLRELAQLQQTPLRRVSPLQAPIAPLQAPPAPLPPPPPPYQAPPVAPPQPRRHLRDLQVVTIASCYQQNMPTVKPLPLLDPSIRERMDKIANSQHHFKILSQHLISILQRLKRRYTNVEREPAPEEDPNYVYAEDEPGYVPPTPRPGTSKRSGTSKRRRPASSSSSEFKPDVTDRSIPGDHSHYPMRLQRADGSFEYVLGPNGTKITAANYGQVFWTSAPVATRCLLTAVFTSQELATHTLTGKPSPAFYGRERPAKKMLDPQRVDDIIVSVRNKTGGKESHIRSTITTKCADTAKKYKRRAKKALQLVNEQPPAE